MYAFNRADKAVEWLAQYNRSGTTWSARLSVGRAVGHTSINLYADGTYAGTLQGDILGAALYKDKNGNGVEGMDIPLTWAMVEAGTREVYRRPAPWGIWICHDITAAVFIVWGFNDQDVYRATPTGSGFVYIAAHLAGKLLWPGTLTILGLHEAWNLLVDGFNAAKRTTQTITRPSSWNFRLW